MESFERSVETSNDPKHIECGAPDFIVEKCKVPEEVWEFKVGGHQVCEKCLKDCKGRMLSGEDITHYQRVVVSLKETIKLMKEIDKAIVKWPID